MDVPSDKSKEPPTDNYLSMGYPGPPPAGFINPVYPFPMASNTPHKAAIGTGRGDEVPLVPPVGILPIMNHSFGGSPAPAPGFALKTTDLEAGEVKGFNFDDKSIRRSFIRKVYGILMVQLMVTFSFVAFALLHRPTRTFFMENPQMFHVSWLCTMVVAISMACCSDLRRKAPMNYIFLSIFTFGQTLMISSLASYFESFEVLLAIGITAIICLSLTLFAFQTKWDFTVMGGVLLAFLVGLLIFGIFSAIFPGKVLFMLYASMGAILFCFYLLYDTQLMMGGKHKYSTSPEEYVFAALNLYLDVVNIFIYILVILGGSRK